MYKFVILALSLLLGSAASEQDLHTGDEVPVSVDVPYRFTADVNKFYLFKFPQEDLKPENFYQIKISFLGTVAMIFRSIFCLFTKFFKFLTRQAFTVNYSGEEKIIL